MSFDNVIYLDNDKYKLLCCEDYNDIDMAGQINAMWAWFNTWGGEFAVSGGKYSEKFTELPIIKKAYDSKYVLTLDEPDW